AGRTLHGRAPCRDRSVSGGTGLSRPAGGGAEAPVGAGRACRVDRHLHAQLKGIDVSTDPAVADGAPKPEAVVRDPVCGMIVDPAACKPHAEHDGRQSWFCCAGCRDRFLANPASYIRAEDPVCGMKVDRASARYLHKHEGERFYFCSERCLSRFVDEPQRYLAGRPAPEAMPPGTIYTCPMHPEIVQEGPGDCPIGGMALEPAGVPDEGPYPELIDFTRRLWVSGLLAIPVFLLAMGPMIGLPVREWLGERMAVMLEFLLATPVVLWAAQPFFRRMVASLRNGSPNMWTLIGIGVGAAYGYSVVAALAPGLFPHSFRSHDGTVAVY